MTSGTEADIIARARSYDIPLTDQPAVSAESVLAAQKRSLELVLQGASVEDVLADMIQVVESSTPGAAAAILVIDPQGRLRTASAAPAFIKEINALDAGLLSAFCAAAAAGATILTQDIASDPLWAASKPLADRLGFKGVWSHPIRDRDKRVLGAFVTFLRERRQPSPFERRLVDTVSQTAALAVAWHESEAALARQRRTLDLAMEAAEMGAWRYTVADNICLYDERATRLYGLTDGRFLHDEENVKRVFHPDDLAPMWAAVSVACDPLGDGRYDVEYRARQPDGGWRWLSAWGIVEFEGEGAARKPVAIAGGSRDITSIKTVQGELQRINATLERRVAEEVQQRLAVEEALRQAQKMEALGQLTGGIAHDFNNLLATILPSLEMARDHVDSDNALKYIGHAMHAAARGARLTHQLLSFSYKQDLVARPVDVNQLVGVLCEMLPRTIGPTIEIKTAPDNRLWLAMSDPSQLELAILNLAINGRDAMSLGGTLTIATENIAADSRRMPRELVREDYVMVSVTDTGIGMAEETRRRAFEPFFTTKARDRGTGLGLSMVYALARDSSGAATIESEVGKGTTVRLYLPRARLTTQRLDRIDGGSALDAGPRSRILLVDDDGGVREVSALMVRGFGHEVVEADSGAAALDILESDKRFDAMIVDLAMPNMHGAVFAVRARRLVRQIPTLFVTGYTDPHWLREISSEQLLKKPFGRLELANKLRELLSEHRVGAAAPRQAH
jgi:signal transduction histidine kinase